MFSRHKVLINSLGFIWYLLMYLLVTKVYAGVSMEGHVICSLRIYWAHGGELLVDLLAGRVSSRRHSSS